MSCLMKSFVIVVVLAASSSAFASPLSDTVAIDGGTLTSMHEAHGVNDFLSEDQPAFSGFVADRSTGNGILMLGEFGQRSIVGQLRSTPMPTPTPEPASLLLLGTGLAGAAALVLRRRRSL